MRDEAVAEAVVEGDPADAKVGWGGHALLGPSVSLLETFDDDGVDDRIVG